MAAKAPKPDLQYIETRNAQIPVVMEMLGIKPDKQVPAEQTPLFFRLMDLQTAKALLSVQANTIFDKLSKINGELEALA